MATYYLRAPYINRANGSSVTAAAAYRAGERIRNERTWAIRDYSHRNDVVHAEIVLPADLAWRADMAWARDRASLWNAVEMHDERSNARLARDWLMDLPAELSFQQRRDLAHRFASELVRRYRCAVDYCIHLPRPTSMEDRHHVHMLTTLREVTAEGLGRCISLELPGVERRRQGLQDTPSQEFQKLRALWAEVTNESLQAGGFPDRVDHRSNAERGIDREPNPTIPKKIWYLEQRTGVRTAAGEAIRARYRERVEARAKGPEELARVIEQQKAQARREITERRELHGAQPRRVRWGALTHEERNQVRRERHRVKRQQLQRDPVALERLREQQRQAVRRYRAAHPERARENHRRWSQDNVEKARESQRRYRESHREELRQRRRERYWADPEASRQHARERSHKRAVRRILLKYSESQAQQGMTAARDMPGLKRPKVVHREHSASQEQSRKSQELARDNGFDFDM